ncbi:MAG: heavy metal translocating P-type ATPase metal-binding domain-containing protein [Bacteroidetes bacterium]|nr:heavy metal translocating P-type ATPase metal-binding domain-containing protein [Bacteroidota bacterium]
MQSKSQEKLICSHCGEDCGSDMISVGDNVFCCYGCRMVFGLLNENGLCDYYTLNKMPGINRRADVRKDKFSFLNDEKIKNRLVSFRNGTETHIQLYLPQIHCSSCLYLLENLRRLDKRIISSTLNFPRKEITIIFNENEISLRAVVELLCSIGYEPYISLNDMNREKPTVSRKLIYQLGVAGFCFANIMLLSFPEYLGLASAEKNLRNVFRSINLLLSLPVLFYSAQAFFSSAWKSLRNKFLNIDAPIAIAILVTFSRSVYEVVSGTGSGYFDSMSGIVFLMLAGRVLQEKTYQQLSFDRDFNSYFPIAVNVLKNGLDVPTPLPEIKPGDTLLIHNDELIPVDGILSRGKAFIDYSFVTGESLPVEKETGEMLYAGGKQTGSNIELLVIHEVSHSYLTKLWNREKKDDADVEKNNSFVHLLSRYFTYIVLLIAGIAACYWWVNDHSRILNAVTAVLIIACPCALLLSSSFTNGNILRILGRNHFYLRSAQTIEDIANVNHFVFDKTGTLTSTKRMDIVYEGDALTFKQQQCIGALAKQSNHPLSVALADYLPKSSQLTVSEFKETHGMGIQGFVDGRWIAIGSKKFAVPAADTAEDSTIVYVVLDHEMIGKFIFRYHYREDVDSLIDWLKSKYRLSVLSGDNAGEGKYLKKLFGPNTGIYFHQTPENKMNYIKTLNSHGDKIAMIGDGLNDAVALRESDVGIAITEDCNNFTPASDAILEAKQLHLLPAFIQLCRANKKIVMASFILSIVYNITGLYFAVQGNLSPLVAAILMPASSISILLITFGSSNLVAKSLRL